MVAVSSRSQMTCSPSGSSQLANPFDSSVNPIPAAMAWRLVHSCPLTHSLNLEVRRSLPVVAGGVLTGQVGVACDDGFGVVKVRPATSARPGRPRWIVVRRVARSSSWASF